MTDSPRYGLDRRRVRNPPRALSTPRNWVRLERGYQMIQRANDFDMLNPESWDEYEEEQQWIAEHVANCTRDGFCYICQCL